MPPSGFLPTVPEAEVHDQGARGLGSGEGLSWVHRWRLAVALRGGRGQGAAWGLSYKSCSPIHGGPIMGLITFTSPPSPGG